MLSNSSDKDSDEPEKNRDSFENAEISADENPVTVAPDNVGDLSDEEMLKILMRMFRGKYKCGACGREKIEEKTEHGKPVFIPHRCSALKGRVQELVRSRGMDIAPARLTELLDQAEARMRADPEAPQQQASDNTPSRGPYKCGRCGLPKKGHTCQVVLPQPPMHLNVAPNEPAIAASIKDEYFTETEVTVEAPPPHEQEGQENPTYAPTDPRMEQASDMCEMKVNDEDDTEALPRHELSTP